MAVMGERTRERRLRHAPTRELSLEELDVALLHGFLSRALYEAERHRRRAWQLASARERMVEARHERATRLAAGS